MLEPGDIIRRVHNEDLERRAIRAWWERHSLIARIRRIQAHDPEAARRAAQHAERWGWEGVLEVLHTSTACPVCGGDGRVGDDIPCPACTQGRWA
ncbi:hypothetical protein QT17_01785 [Thermus sp. 2.9]|uniref:hypothetical protein n=1 Tax=Thermus sp. (strain 2.9) TaxID=1577051 RepID=UPI0005436B3C|nr:hypothetical protein [Thermus sp. 2.9]KHG66070.1 hypothetical protein QT17_01785 [Thermus sp. 2.9]